MPQKTKPRRRLRPAQRQRRQPGLEGRLRPAARAEPAPAARRRLENRVALITGGDSGIGRAVALAFAEEGADVAIVYRNEHKDAADTRRRVETHGRRCITIAGDIGEEGFCRRAVRDVVRGLGRLDIVVNNAAEQHPQESLNAVTARQLERTFRTNVYGMFFTTKAALPHLKAGSAIINTSSVTAYRGSHHLLDYSATKGAIVTFTRSLSEALTEEGIRVNAVAPGPIWTPLIPASFEADRVAKHGSSAPMERAGQPNEVAPCYVFLASEDASYISGQVLHPNGGNVVGS
jgi:NAD(P)-dependent dehydrogenase (short-subunit alcohol dehydrogenase family)